MGDERLKACPFCGEEADPDVQELDPWLSAAWCIKCCARGPTAGTLESAAEKWNERAEPSINSAEVDKRHGLVRSFLRHHLPEDSDEVAALDWLVERIQPARPSMRACLEAAIRETASESWKRSVVKLTPLDMKHGPMSFSSANIWLALQIACGEAWDGDAVS